MMLQESQFSGSNLAEVYVVVVSLESPSSTLVCI